MSASNQRALVSVGEVAAMDDAPGGHVPTEGHPDVAATRRELLESIERWRAELQDARSALSTAWFGIASRAVTLVEVLMLAAAHEVVPSAEMPHRPTLGELRQLLDRYGRKVTMTCLGRPRRLITDGDLRVIQEILDGRNRIAHHAERVRDPAEAGRMASAEVLRLLDSAEAFAALPIFAELECRHEQGPTSMRSAQPVQAIVTSREDHVATLFINDDYSRCGACGRDADLDNIAHLPGCGARFVRVSSDLDLTPPVRAGIARLRPDLPFEDDPIH